MEKRNFRDLTFRVYRSEARDPVQLFIFHGICEHSFRYLPFIKHLNRIGFDCTMIDHPGHGQQVNAVAFNDDFYKFYDSVEEDLEKATHKILDISTLDKPKSFQKAFSRKNKKLHLNDIITFQKDFYDFVFREKVFSRNQPTMLLGQSMGGLIAADLSSKINDLAGTILLSPAFRALPKPLKQNSSADKIRHKVETSIISKSDESFEQRSLFSTALLKPLLSVNPLSDCSWAGRYISDMEEVNDLFLKDPYIGRKLSLKFLQSIQKNMKEQRNLKEEFPCPVYIEFGLEDKIVCPEGSKEFIANRLTGKNHFFKPLKDFMPHEIHNSKRRNYLVNDIQEWLQKLT